MLKLYLKIIFVLISALFLTIVTDFIYRKKYNLNYNLPQNVLPKPEIENKYDLVALGNSHAQDAYVFDQYKLKALNLTSVAQAYEYDLAMLKMHKNQIKPGAIILIPVDPISFSQIKPKDNKKNTNSLYYDGRLSPFLIPRLRVSDYLQKQIFPFVRSGYVWRQENAKAAEEKGLDPFVKKFNLEHNIKNETIIDPPKPSTISAKIINPLTTRKGIVEILNNPPLKKSQKEINTDFIVNKWLRTDGFDKSYFQTNKKDLEKIIDYTLQNNWQPILVTIPISQELINALGEDYLNTYIYEPFKTSNTQNSPYYNFMNEKRITQNNNLFSNSDHLNRVGGSLFSYLLLINLIKDKHLPENVNGYLK